MEAAGVEPATGVESGVFHLGLHGADSARVKHKSVSYQRLARGQVAQVGRGPESAGRCPDPPGVQEEHNPPTGARIS